MRPTPPRLLTIAGSDSGGGAGIQADLKTFAAHGVFGMSVITAVTAQNTRAVTAVHELPPAVVRAQLAAVFSDLGADAVKVGMLASAELIKVVAAALSEFRPRYVVVDPVMVAKSGAQLLRDDAVAALLTELLPLATVITPNLPEAARLTGLPTGSESERAVAARQLKQSGAAVLLKGGHAPGAEVVDLLFVGQDCHRFTHPRLETSATHGTGCTLSSALACGLARGHDLPTAVAHALDYVWGAMAAAYPVGHGQGPVNHLYQLDRQSRDGGADASRESA